MVEQHFSLSDTEQRLKMVVKTLAPMAMLSAQSFFRLQK
jgi:hypothetical protein